ncbi:hypothetical protein VFPPC_15925 [Pochonia chlamydosporia 170]|uniref:Uncharacterized protein n=1 Tax=Pochonia chlamydosporia 170 TaxID=1380566 RepID=A0A179FVU1_METCM|nr:hypothetical protein VFPPC_15925 [Pochonia chlamydosporia 170]OAQ69193.1 hypothetical protein VFPPC_15925 [Pochonia chlamydosporia 170]
MCLMENRRRANREVFALRRTIGSPWTTLPGKNICQRSIITPMTPYYWQILRKVSEMVPRGVKIESSCRRRHVEVVDIEPMGTVRGS